MICPESFSLTLQYLSTMDVNGDGLLTYSELMTSLHAVTPKTAATTTSSTGYGSSMKSSTGGLAKFKLGFSLAIPTTTTG